MLAGTEVLNFSRPATPAMTDRRLQATIERQGRRAGLLSARFTPNAASTSLSVTVPVGITKREGCLSVGLSAADAQAVLDGIQSVAATPTVVELGAGTLEISWALTHAIDSSEDGFRDLATKLVAILTLPEVALAEAVWTAWRRIADAVRLIPLLDHLDMLCERRPEVCDFRPGATPSELADLERALELQLPETLRSVLMRVNGGKFIDNDEHPEYEAEEVTDNRVSCALLGTAEIRQAYLDLIATNETHVELSGWANKRPVRPRLALPGGSRAVWPYVPIAWTVEGREMLVLEVLVGGAANGVLDAFHEISPAKWGELYEGHVEFMEDYIAMAGSVKAISGIS
ncbi:SMI1/KNR4 family protein [Glacieibacterium megasporae]|uniref:SMI1/KNR4 family protein n=1 Tax=Glacieibacterium megasporae TaxID=2835787 RepID=UPI001C1E7E0B|nr:SMI1/KNR4 family protein [Polymorphobacter megasporae]UAJ12539.1 SMI1/KNR4 family protein [Polymorphobacter megasporae]